MKKLATALALTIISFSGFSQKVKFGAKAGLNYSSLSGNNTTAKAGVLIGGLVEIKLTDKLSFQPELFYATAGGKYNYTGAFSTGVPYIYNQSINITTFNLPLLLKINLTDKLNLIVGPQITFLDKATSKVNVNVNRTENNINEVTNFDADYDFGSTSTIITFSQVRTFSNGSSTEIGVLPATSDYKPKSTTYSLNLGGSYDITSKVFIEARYNLAITRFVENANLFSSKFGNEQLDPKTEDLGFKNSNIQLSVGYKF